MNNKSYQIPSAWVGRPLDIVLVGAGGTGSVMLGALAQLAHARREMRLPQLNVTVVDDDQVSPANIGRQAFFQPDVGQYKAQVLTNRINQAFGLDFEAKVDRLTENSRLTRTPDLWIGCVDSRKARQAIHHHYSKSLREETIWGGPQAWLDCGNLMRTGQVVLGVHGVVATKTEKDGVTREHKYRTTMLPCVADLFPETIDASQDGTDDVPSCSLADSLKKQDLFTNRMVADVGANLLWQLLRHGRIDCHGAFINLESMRIVPMAIDPKAWARMGYQPEQAHSA